MSRDSMLNIPEKIEQYEAFINDRLKADLKTVLGCRDKLVTQVASYHNLKTCIEKMKQGGDGEMKMLSDLGCNFYCKAKVPNTSKVYVEVGLGFFVEFTLNEAHRFIEKKITLMNRDCDALTEEATQINAKIKLALEALNEIQFGSKGWDQAM